MSAPMGILGIGAVTPLGRDLAAIAGRIRDTGPNPPNGARVSEELLTDPAISKRMRRADRFSRMAAVAALDAWKRAGGSRGEVARGRIGLIVTSGFGPHCRGFRFLDGLLDCGDSAASPTDFSHSVHGTAAAYITELLELRGPVLSTTDFEVGFEEAVVLAQCWLSEGTCQRVLVGAVEELGEVMLHCVGRMIAPEQPTFLGEGALFFMLGPNISGAIATLDVTTGPPGTQLRNADESQNHLCRSATDSAFRLLAALLGPETENVRVAVGAPAGLREASLIVTRKK
jgi:hypothetical protein